MMMNCDQIKELLEAYALGALDTDERSQVESHLAACPACQMIAVELTEVAHTLPQAVASATSVQPPVALKENLLQIIQDQGNNHTYLNPKEIIQPTHKQFTATPPTRRGGAKVWWQSRMASVGGVLILLILAVVLGTRLSVVLAEGRALQAELSTLYNQQELVLEVVDSEQTVKRFLRTQIPPGDSGLPAYGKLYTREGLPHAVAMAARLPQPTPGQAYHLWITEEEQTKLAGVLTLNDQGFGLLVFDEDSDNLTYDTAWLTLQPIGSDSPAEPLILLWDPTQP